jgi:hypothetical protein
MSMMRQTGQLSWMDRPLSRWQYSDAQQCFNNTRRPDAVRSTIPPEWIGRDGDCWTVQMPLHPTNNNYLPLNPYYFIMKQELCHQMTMSELEGLQMTICHSDMCIHMLLFPVHKVSMLMHLPRIASTIQIIIQICCQNKNHPLDSILSVLWYSANIYFVGQRSRFNEPGSEDQHW